MTEVHIPRRVGSALMAVLLVGSVLAGVPGLAPVGTAAADASPQTYDSPTEFSSIVENSGQASVQDPGVTLQSTGFVRFGVTVDENVTLSFNSSTQKNMTVQVYDSDFNTIASVSGEQGSSVSLSLGSGTGAFVRLDANGDAVDVDRLEIDGGETSTSSGDDGSGGSESTNLDTSCGARDGLSTVYGGLGPLGAAYQVKSGLDCALDYFEAVEYKAALEDNQTAIDIYSAARQVDKNRQEADAVRDNYLQDTRTVAYAKGQEAVFNALNQNLSESEVRSEAKQAVKDYYARIQVNYIRRVGRQSFDLVQLSKRAENESGISNSLIGPSGTGENDDGYFHTTENASVTLVNGSQVNMRVPRFWIGGQAEDYTLILIDDGQIDYPESSVADTAAGNISVEAVDDKPSFNAYEYTDQTARFDRIQSVSSQMVDNIDKFANETYEPYQNATLSIADAINPLTLAQQFSTDYNSTGYYVYALASLSSIGYNVPDVNQTAEMRIELLNGTEKTGLLASSSSPPGGTWEIGKTYNPDRLQGTELFLTTDGGVFEIDQPFTVKNITDYEGNSLQETKSQQYSYTVINNSEYVTLQENLTDLRLVIEEKQALAGGGGETGGGFDFGGLFGGLIPGLGAGVTALLIGLLLYLGLVSS